MLFIRFIDLFTITPLAATGINKGVCHFDVACGSWMYLWRSLKKSFNTFKKAKELG